MRALHLPRRWPSRPSTSRSLAPRPEEPILLALVLAMAACGSSVERESAEGAQGAREASGSSSTTGGGGGPVESACGGAITTTPRALASGLADGFLFVAGDDIVLAERETGRIVTIDRCSGAIAELGDVDPATSATLNGDELVVVSDGQATFLTRVPLSGGTALATEVEPGTEVAAHGGRLFAMWPLEPEDDTARYSIVELDRENVPSPIAELEIWFGSFALLGASGAGLYVRPYPPDCGCNPRLEVVPLDGEESTFVESTAGVSELALAGGKLVVATDLDPGGFGEVVLDVVRLPLAGGEPEVLVAKDEEHTYDVRRIAANERAVCWGPYAQPLRCVGGSSGASPRVLGSEEDRADVEAIAMSVDAVYWLRAATDGNGLELAAAVP